MRHLGKLVDPHLEIGGASTDRRTATKHGDVEGSGRRWSRWCDWSNRNRGRRRFLRRCRRLLWWHGRFEMEEQLNSACQRDAGAERGPKAPVTGRFDGRAIEGRDHAARELDARDVSLGVDTDLHGNIAVRAAGNGFLRISSLRLLHYLRRLDRWRRRVLSTCTPPHGKQGTEGKKA